MANGENNYGLSEGVFKACQFLGLEFPPTPLNKSQLVPSDYFGEDFELDSATIGRLCSEREWLKESFVGLYTSFTEKFLSQKNLNRNTMNLNAYFCDYVLFSRIQNAALPVDYFDFEFYRKPFATRRTFFTRGYRDFVRNIGNDFDAIKLEHDKAETNKLFAAFLHRDWLDTRDCSFEEFKNFIEKHPRFFSKLVDGDQGKGAEIITVDSNKNLRNIFAVFKSNYRILEEVIVQHESLQEFCPNTVNTIRVNTFLDVHNVVHILTTSGRFGKAGQVIDNLHGGGYAVVIDLKTGIIISDAINDQHQRVQRHPDTGKVFRGFQYPAWEKMCETVVVMAKMIPQLRHVGWDIAINNKGEAILVEINGNQPTTDIQQAPDDKGKLHLYLPLLEELINYKMRQMILLGYRSNNLSDFDSLYDPQVLRKSSYLKFAMSTLAPDCKSLMDLGCRQAKLVKALCPPNVEYYPVDFKKHDDEVIACDFNEGEFPNIMVDTILCAFTAEYVERLPQFLANMCNAAQKQILMWCYPFGKEAVVDNYRWTKPFLTDFTEKFLIDSMRRNNFKLAEQYYAADNRALILYDFRKILPEQ